MKLLTNEQITAACAELDIVRSNRLNNAFIANIEGRKEDADRHTAAATAMHWAIQKLMEDWNVASYPTGESVPSGLQHFITHWAGDPATNPYSGFGQGPHITYKDGVASVS